MTSNFSKGSPSPKPAKALGETASKRRTRRFAHNAFKIFLIGHLYVGWRLIPDLQFSLESAFVAVTFLAITNILIPYGTMARRFVDNQETVDHLVWAGGLTMSWFSSLLVLTILRDATLLIPASAPWREDSALWVILAASTITIIGLINARMTARVKRVDIPIAGLSDALNGFTIVQITDVHVGPTIKSDYVHRIVKRVNNLAADAVAITGDMVDNTVDILKDHTAPLGELRARHGSYVVTGNHEYYSGADDWMAEFRRLGLKTLADEHVVIDHDGAQLVMAGVNDYSALSRNPDETSPELHGSNPEKALAGSPSGVPKILLAHQPRSATAASEAGFDVQLSGHTHGGQFWPWSLFVRLQQPFTAGLNQLGELWVYTSRGTGYWGPPNRFGAPSEITLIRLIPSS